MKTFLGDSRKRNFVRLNMNYLTVLFSYNSSVFVVKCKRFYDILERHIFLICLFEKFLISASVFSKNV